MGGKVAMALALRHPASVARLCVVDVSPTDTGQVSGFARYVEGMRSLDLSSLTDRADADARLSPYVPEASIRSFLLQNLRRSGTGAGARWHWQMNLDLLGNQLPEITDWPDPDAAPYPGPTLWLAGANSDYVQPEHAPAMRALFPRVRLVTIKGASHWLHSDQPEVTVAVLRRFLHLPAPAAGETVS